MEIITLRDSLSNLVTSIIFNKISFQLFSYPWSQFTNATIAKA